jgi:sucrose phosphorylase
MSWKRIAYAEEPDFSKPLLEVPAEKGRRIFERLQALYGSDAAHEVMPEIIRLIRVQHAHKPKELIEAEASFEPENRFTERDLVLITYGDMVRSERHSPLAALARFLDGLRRHSPVFNTLHILPFFPYSSDRGFSITDHRTVNPKLGSWKDIEEIGNSFRMMFDAVFNHASSKSLAFLEMLSGNPLYKDFAITFGSKDELSLEHRKILRRPRTSDILTTFDSINGPLWAWTTFSPDQIDLNYRNPRVLLNVIDTLLFYVRKGANLVRLDAVTYLWVEMGTTGANLEQTHQVIKLFRDVLDVAAPSVSLVTETNVPHLENVAYFGDGRDEAQMVYNFSLPPLVLHSFYRGDAARLSQWAANLQYPAAGATYLNILDTHDGIGLPGAIGALPQPDIDYLVERARQQGAFISNKATGEGEVPYEINCTWYSALNVDNGGEQRAFQVKRFAASRSIALALRGVPGIYFHGLIGSRNDVRLALETRIKRDVNRAMVDENYLERHLNEPDSKLHHIKDQLGRMLEVRTAHPAFHPNGPQQVLFLSPQLFAALRRSPEAGSHVLALTNVTDRPCQVELSLDENGVPAAHWYDLLHGRGWIASKGKLPVSLQPYDVFWLSPFRELETMIESGNFPRFGAAR